MLIHPTIDGLRRLRLNGMVRALEHQDGLGEIENLGFEERLGLLVEQEIADRESRQLNARLKKAKLKQSACPEEVDWKHKRGLDKKLFLRLLECHWVNQHHNAVVLGPTGVGKTWLACALANKACREGFSCRYIRLPRLFQELEIGKGDGQYEKLLRGLSRTDLVIFDDWGIGSLSGPHRSDLLEIIDDRHQSRSTIITTQLHIEHWHKWIGDGTMADAIIDRLLHNAYRIELKGETLRQSKKPLLPKEDLK